MENVKTAKFAGMKIHFPEMGDGALHCELEDVQAYPDCADVEWAKHSGVIESLG